MEFGNRVGLCAKRNINGRVPKTRTKKPVVISKYECQSYQRAIAMKASLEAAGNTVTRQGKTVCLYKAAKSNIRPDVLETARAKAQAGAKLQAMLQDVL